jgi:hypothetical protein
VAFKLITMHPIGRHTFDTVEALRKMAEGFGVPVVPELIVATGPALVAQRKK